MSIIKNRLSFNIFFNERNKRSYLVQSFDKDKALTLESYLIGCGFKVKYSRNHAEWNHHARKNFNLRIVLSEKKYYRTSQIVKLPHPYENVFDIAFFDDFCFRFVLVEKKPKISK
jgi:hypothetical protein